MFTCTEDSAKSPEAKRIKGGSARDNEGLVLMFNTEALTPQLRSEIPHRRALASTYLIEGGSRRLRQVRARRRCW